MDASSNHACATCPIVARCEACSSLLGHHGSDGSDGTAAEAIYLLL
jgi:hypothetical protein